MMAMVGCWLMGVLLCTQPLDALLFTCNVPQGQQSGVLSAGAQEEKGELARMVRSWSSGRLLPLARAQTRCNTRFTCCINRSGNNAHRMHRHQHHRARLWVPWPLPT